MSDSIQVRAGSDGVYRVFNRVFNRPCAESRSTVASCYRVFLGLDVVALFFFVAALLDRTRGTLYRVFFFTEFSRVNRRRRLKIAGRHRGD